MSRRCAIFDLDRTVTVRGTWLRFLLHANRHRPGFLPELALLGLHALAWKLGLASRDAVKETGLRSLSWASRTRLAAIGTEFASRERAIGVRPGALAQIARHRQAGDCLVLITAAPEITAEPFARVLGFDHVICTPVVWSADDRPTGSIALPNCYGAAKAARLGALAERLGGIELVAAYSDHVSDLGLLLAAARGVAVNPSPALRRALVGTDVEIADWGRPYPLSAPETEPEVAS